MIREIRDLTGTDDELGELWCEVSRAAVRYAHIRAQWRFWPLEERQERDAERTRAHDALISCVNALARAMTGAGMSVGWRERLGTDRKEIGDFACHLTCILGLEAR